MSVQVLYHLHFSDEPRINPWLGVEGEPPGYRVTPSLEEMMKRVWGAHTASRVIAPDGMIENIVNNLSWCSFSFAPEVLTILKNRAPNVYHRILDADQRSTRRLGWGNAVATSFSGAILPLLSPQAIELDIVLGLLFFEDTFQRKARGFWCPELAISNYVADVLLANGISYTFVSPWQIQAISEEGTGRWQVIGPHSYDGYPVLRLKRPRGTLHLLVFHPDLHQNVLEGTILHHSQSLEDKIRLVSEKSKNLVIDAHHGEHFGFTEPYADMCLADLIHRTQAATDFTWVNGDVVLEKARPSQLAKLKRGEGEFGTSWSCVHGLARWYRDCGCRSHSEPNWHQAWRAPLKDLQYRAFDRVFQKSCEIISSDPQELGSRILRAIMMAPAPGHESPDRDQFLAAWALALAYKGLHQSAWYYADPFQNPCLRALGNMLRALEILEHRLGSESIRDYLDDLSKIPSNLGGSDFGLKDLVLKRERRSPSYIAVSVILQRIQGNPTPLTTGFWRVQESELTEKSLDSQNRIYGGRVLLHDQLLDEKHEFQFTFTEDLMAGLSLELTRPQQGTRETIDFHHLDQSEGKRLLAWIIGKMLQLIAPIGSEIYSTLKQVSAWFRFFHEPIPEALQYLTQDLISRRLQQLDVSLESWQIWDEEFRFAQEHGLNLEKESLRRRVSHMISGIVSAPDSLSDAATVKKLESILNHTRQWNIEPDLTIPQNILWAQLRWWGSVVENKGGKLSRQDKNRQELLFHCARLIGIKPTLPA